MEMFFGFLANGLALGALYSLIVTGLNLQMLISNVVNFAYGPVVVMGIYAAQWVMVARNGGFLLGAFAAMAVTVVLLVVSEPLLRPLSKKKAVLETIVVTLGISMIINEIASQY